MGRQTCTSSTQTHSLKIATQPLQNRGWLRPVTWVRTQGVQCVCTWAVHPSCCLSYRENTAVFNTLVWAELAHVCLPKLGIAPPSYCVDEPSGALTYPILLCWKSVANLLTLTDGRLDSRLTLVQRQESPSASQIPSSTAPTEVSQKKHGPGPEMLRLWDLMAITVKISILFFVL